jgi:hypothetical protein
MAEETLDEMLDEADVTATAAARYADTDGYQAALKANYTKWYHWYHPLNGDQWPEDLAERPGFIHITDNKVAPIVDVAARIQAKLPKLALVPASIDEQSVKEAEFAEKVHQRFLEDSGWDVWLGTLTRTKGIFGKSFLHPFWNTDDDRPDVSVIENPGNLRIGWGASDFSRIDWAIYEYALSPLAAMTEFPGIDIPPQASGKKLTVIRGGDHSDPLDTLGGGGGTKMLSRPVAYNPSSYEGRQVLVWDYWYKDRTGKVYNARLVGGVLAESPKAHPELPDIPYILVENDHVPGSPEGRSDVEGILDLQVEFNRTMSHWAQLVNDEIDPAWQTDAESLPPNTVPKAGQIIPLGEGHSITPIAKPFNATPLTGLIETYYKAFHFDSGLPEILFSMPPGAQTAGRALAIQIESAANRIDPRRDLIYAGLRKLLRFWTHMIVKVNPKIRVPNDAPTLPQQPGMPAPVVEPFKEVGLGDLVETKGRWRVTAPEITPRDIIENTTNVLNKIQAKTISLEDGMDELGVDSPHDMIEKIRKERIDPQLFPGDTQAYVAVMRMLQELQMQGQAAQQAQVQAAAQAGAQSQGAQQAAAQAAIPSGSEAQNQSAPTQPASMPGSPPPPGGPAPSGLPFSNQTLIRAQPSGGAQVLQQTRVGG